MIAQKQTTFILMYDSVIMRCITIHCAWSQDRYHVELQTMCTT